MKTKNMEVMKEDMQEEMESSPFDSILERIRSYKENPELATRQTLGELETELMDLKDYVDVDSEEEVVEQPKGLSGILGKVAK